MRTTFEFEASGVSHEELQEKAQELIAKFLSIEISEVEAKTDVEMHVTANDKTFTAKVYVRVK